MTAAEIEAAAALDALRRIVRCLRLADRDIEAACGISVAQLFVLHHLAAGDALSIGELADRTLTDQSSVSTVVARLVDRGLVARKAAAGDRRRAELTLTARGKKLAASAPRVPQSRMIDAMRAMSVAQREELVRSLQRLASSIGADQLAPRMLFEDEAPRLTAGSSLPSASRRARRGSYRSPSR